MTEVYVRSALMLALHEPESDLEGVVLDLYRQAPWLTGVIVDILNKYIGQRTQEILTILEKLGQENNQNRKATLPIQARIYADLEDRTGFYLALENYVRAFGRTAEAVAAELRVLTARPDNINPLKIRELMIELRRLSGEK